MARKVDTLAPRKGRPAQYDWDGFLDGSVWELEAGKDFTSTGNAFLSQARKAAKDRGLNLATRTIETVEVTDERGRKVKDSDGNVKTDASIVQIQAFVYEDEDESEDE